MKLNGQALGWAALIAILQALPITYYAQNPHPTNWDQLFKIDFVMAYLTVLGGNALFAHLNFRDSNQRTRSTDPNASIPSKTLAEILAERNKGK